MAYTSGQARAISHRDWSRKKAPISRVGSYDFNGTVDRATMKMHMAAANRPVSTAQRVLTLWPLSSTAIDKNECFAVREREVLWTMRAGKGMGRTTDGRMKALSSLNYFRLVLQDWQLDELKGLLKAATTGVLVGPTDRDDNDKAMRILTALVGDKRMQDEDARTIKEVHLNKIDEHLRHYVLGTIQYAGVVITGEEPGSKQSLQGIAVTVGGLNTLANNGDKTLCPGMKLCMTVPRCVPDSTQWPAPCDHIGLPHGKVTPILRQADAQDLTQAILGGTQHIHTQVARMMSGCGGYGGAMKECKAPQDVYFAFVHANRMEPASLERVTNEITYSVDNMQIQEEELDVMRRMNDAVVFTMHANETTTLDKHRGKARFDESNPFAATMLDDTNFVFGAGPNNKETLPLIVGVPECWRIALIAYGNVRDVVFASLMSRMNGGNGATGSRMFAVDDASTGAQTQIPGRNAQGFYFPGLMEQGITQVFVEKYNSQVPACLSAQGDRVGNAADPDAKQYAAMIVDIMENVQQKLGPQGNSVNLVHVVNQMLPNAGTVERMVKPNKVVYHQMQAVSNGNAAFALGVLEDPDENSDDKLDADEKLQPNLIVMDDDTSLPWDDAVIEGINTRANANHSTVSIIFRKHFEAPLRQEYGAKNTHIEVSDNELPFVGAWVALHRNAVGPGAGINDNITPYRSNFAPERFLVHESANLNYYYLTWSALVHLTCYNVLQKTLGGKKILEMQRAQLLPSVHYGYEDDDKEPALQDTPNRKFGAPGLGAYLQAILKPDTNNATKYQDYLRKHSPIASLVNNVIRATVEAVTQHQLATDKKTVGMALSSAGRGEAVDVVLTGAV